MHIRPPDSTNSTRRRKGQPPYPTLRRRRKIERRGEWIDPLTDPETLERAGYTIAPELPEDTMAVATTPLQRLIVGLLMAGLSEREIAQSTGTTRHQIRRIIAIMRSRPRA